MKNFRFFALLLVVLSFSSCATILTGTHTKVYIESTPPGAKILVDGENRGTTPQTVRLKRGLDQASITLKKEGYQSMTFEPKQSFQLWSILNLVSPFHWAVDVLSGSFLKYDPKSYDLELTPINEAKPTEGTVTTTVIQQTAVPSK